MTGSGAGPERLTEAEVAQVLRRAAELDAGTVPTTGGLEVAALEDAAREVGLSETAMRLAVAELRAGSLPAPATAPGRLERYGTRMVRVERLIVVDADDARRLLSSRLRRETFAVRRDDGDRVVWEQRSDVAANLRRKLDMTGRLSLKHLRHLSVAVSAVPDGATLVCVETDLGSLRNGILGVAAGGPAAAVAVAGGVAVDAGVGILAVGALPVAGAVGYAGLRVGAAVYRRRAERVADTLTRLLDRIGPPVS